jgi:glutamate 5-kinase
MTASDNPRAALASAARVLVKVGSRALTEGERGRFAALAAQIAALRQRGHVVVLVSSGAVAMGCRRLGLNGRPRSLPELQAVAAVGQSRVMQAYEEAFAPHGIAVGQVLLTHSGLSQRSRYLNAQHAVSSLIDLGVVPIVNENDTVSTEEIEFGDNDQLASMIVPLVGADLLVLLSDVEGLLDAQRARVPLVRDISEAEALVWEENGDVGLGGMRSKLSAAQRALVRGTPVVIAAAAEDDALVRVMAGEDVGTLFLPQGAGMASRKHWIAYTLRTRGSVVVDDGAVRAIARNKRSLLPAGVVDVKGAFRAGDAIAITDASGNELARGLARYDARDVRLLQGAQSDAIEERLGHYAGEEIVHRDDLVLLGEALE